MKIQNILKYSLLTIDIKMYNKEEEVEEKKFFTDRINITIILIFKIRKSLLTIDIADHKR